MDQRRRAQSEVIGTVLLVMLAVTATTTVGFFLLDGQSARIENRAPLADFLTEFNDSHLTLTHAGGEKFEFATLDLALRQSAAESLYNLEDYRAQTDGDDYFEPGETVTVSHSFTGETRILLFETDRQGYVLYDETKRG